ncbi:MAG TPA: DUF3108 domain-containing protein [Gammaproteobacteria bacterium]
MTRAWMIAAALVVAADAARSADAPVATYTANYLVEYKGKDAGSAELAVRKLPDSDLYEFTSTVMAKGLLKLARPKPAVERSHFRVVAGDLQPLEFWYEDGSRSGEDNVHVVFDWDRGVVTFNSAEARREMPVPQGAVDRGTLQVARMLDFASPNMPSKYTIVDDDSVGEYDYTDNGTATITTKAGTHETRVFTQQRAGSSRTTQLWVAPAMQFLPVRIEQRRNGEVQTALVLVDVKGLTPSR